MLSGRAGSVVLYFGSVGPVHRKDRFGRGGSARGCIGTQVSLSAALEGTLSTESSPCEAVESVMTRRVFERASHWCHFPALYVFGPRLGSCASKFRLKENKRVGIGP